jgi:hypothetical protein
MREFDQLARADDAGGGSGGEDLEDEDIVVTGNDFMNAACPISGKNVRRGVRACLRQGRPGLPPTCALPHPSPCELACSPPLLRLSPPPTADPPGAGAV